MNAPAGVFAVHLFRWDATALFFPRGSIGRKYSERSQLTFSWLLGKYTRLVRGPVHLCARCMATCHVRVSCNTTRSLGSSRSRVCTRKGSCLWSALLWRFYRRAETPAHNPRPTSSGLCTDREGERKRRRKERKRKGRHRDPRLRNVGRREERAEQGSGNRSYRKADIRTAQFWLPARSNLNFSIPPPSGG